MRGRVAVSSTAEQDAIFILRGVVRENDSDARGNNIWGGRVLETGSQAKQLIDSILYPKSAIDCAVSTESSDEDRDLLKALLLAASKTDALSELVPSSPSAPAE